MTQHKLQQCEHGLCCQTWCKRCGGLNHCVVCGGAEATLPKECPGYVMAEDTMLRVIAGWIDFWDGQWYALGDPSRRGKGPNRPTPGAPGGSPAA